QPRGIMTSLFAEKPAFRGLFCGHPPTRRFHSPAASRSSTSRLHLCEMAMNPDTPQPRRPVTLRTIRKMARQGEPFACLTCYDATTARWLEAGGVHVLLVGDTAAEIVLGYDSTIHMPLDIAIALTAAVKRGAPRTMVMGDMPFMSYQGSADEAMVNAARFLTEGHADIIKIEADRTLAPLIERMTRAGIPVCAHVGAKPQQVGLTGGYSS